MGFGSFSRKRQAIAGFSAAVVAASAFGIYQVTSGNSEKPPVNIDFILGGGTTNATSGKNIQGSKLAVHGKFRGIAAATDGTIYLFTQEDQGMVMWNRKTSGSTEQIPVTGMDGQTAEQAAVTPDGSVYLATGDLWKVSPNGSATKIIDTDCKKDTSTAASTKVGQFCTGQVTGVTVAKDGSVYFGDEITLGHRGSFVHKISGDNVELIAGRSSKDGESLKRSNPAVQNGINPPADTKAKAVLVPDVWNSGWLAADENELYWRTGPGIVRINADGTLSPLVGAKDPAKVTKASVPFQSIGRALDAEIGDGALDQLRGDLAVVSERTEVYYTDAEKAYSPPFSSEYLWGGDKSTSQNEFIQNLAGGKALYRVTAGQVSPVAVGAQGIAASGTSLYIAAQSSTGGKESADSSLTAVLQVELPQEK